MNSGAVDRIDPPDSGPLDDADSASRATAESTAGSATPHPGRVLTAIPAYNEAAGIADVVAAAAAHSDSVLVIDDGSTDDTVERAAAAGAEVIRHDRNRGYGAALTTAFREANDRNVDRLVILDGDGQHDPSDIPHIVSSLRTTAADIVIGSRFQPDSTTDVPLYRQLGIIVINLLLNLSIGRYRPSTFISDTQSGFRVYDRPVIDTLAEAGLSDDMEASIEILYHAQQWGYTIAEVGTDVTYDVTNANSRHPLTHGLGIVRAIGVHTVRDRPLALIGLPGALVILLAIGLGTITLQGVLAGGGPVPAAAVGSVLSALIGVSACLAAVHLHRRNLDPSRTG